jgi:hypothetical protein
MVSSKSAKRILKKKFAPSNRASFMAVFQSSFLLGFLKKLIKTTAHIARAAETRTMPQSVAKCLFNRLKIELKHIIT